MVEEINDPTLKYGNMKQVSIGYKREDGDFAIVATLNNNDGHWNAYQFDWLVCEIIWNARNFAKLENIEAVERIDTPDYGNRSEWENELKPELETSQNPQEILDKVDLYCKEENVVLVNKPWGIENNGG